jgi:hypothetical protein
VLTADFFLVLDIVHALSVEEAKERKGAR